MAQFDLQGTKFICEILPLDARSNGYFVKTRIEVKNEFVSYQYEGKNISREDMENWIFAMFRFLAGGYGKEYSISFENAGMAVDFYPYTKNGEEVSREERRKNDGTMAIRLLLRNADSFLGGVYTFLLNKEQIEIFATALREEFYKEYAKLDKKKGKYLLVGVSPQGYVGCNYWYLDDRKITRTGDYVWVRMGKRRIEQIVYVDCARFYDDEDIPYVPNAEKRILRVATLEEVNAWKKQLSRSEK